MEKIDLDEYRDEFGYISNILLIYNDLRGKKIDFDLIHETLKEIEKNNREIIAKVKKESKKVIKHPIKKSDYVKQIKESLVNLETKEEDTNISFYISYINSNEDYLEILPKSKEKESIEIIDKILIYYYKEICNIKLKLSSEKDIEWLSFYEEYLAINLMIYDNIKKYKQSLLEKQESIEDSNNLNHLSYFMDDNKKMYILSDMGEDKREIASILNLIDGIKKGIFKNIDYFTNNDKIRGICEVKDKSVGTRVIFDINNYNILGALTKKSNTNSIYMKWLINRVMKYKENPQCQEADIKKYVLGGIL